MADDRDDVSAVLVAVLKAIGEPATYDHVRRVALYCLEPALLWVQLDPNDQKAWARIYTAGPAIPLGEWGAAVRGLRARGRLVEDLHRGTWALGDGGPIDTSGWPDDRARFVVEALRRETIG